MTCRRKEMSCKDRLTMESEPYEYQGYYGYYSQVCEMMCDPSTWVDNLEEYNLTADCTDVTRSGETCDVTVRNDDNYAYTGGMVTCMDGQYQVEIAEQVMITARGYVVEAPMCTWDCSNEDCSDCIWSASEKTTCADAICEKSGYVYGGEYISGEGDNLCADKET
eukprot:UN34656